MEIERSNQYGRLMPETLRAFERRLDAILPDDYRAFLLTHNGGCPIPSDFEISAAEGGDSLHNTYGLHDGPEYARLDLTYEIYRDRLPGSLLAIADDPFGNAGMGAPPKA